MGEFPELCNKLCNRLSALMMSDSPQAEALRAVCSALASRGLKAILIGGTLRDLVVFGDKQSPRDFDLVVDANTEELSELFHAKMLRRTRFGGFHIRHKGWPLDIWSLEQTWAFQHMAIAPSIENLPKTTFLNVEAIAVDLSSPGYWKEARHENGFFSAITNRTVEINLWENPYPALCVVRSLITAWKLDFAIGQKLGNYIRQHGASLTTREMNHIQNEHYGHLQLSSDLLRSWIDDILKNSTESVIIIRR